MRRAQSLVEFAICLPFLLLLMGALTEFGIFLHRRAELWGVARAGALELSRLESEPDRVGLSRLRRRMLFLGEPLGLELGDIELAPEPTVPGHYRVVVRTRHQGLTPFDWLGEAGGSVEVRLVVPVEGVP